MALDPALTEYSDRYEETQAFSGTFNAFHHDLADGLVQRHNLRGKHIAEVGCGKGEFLALLCDLGGNTGLGIDPGADPERLEGVSTGQIELITDFFVPSMITRTPDLLACKMTLEHIPAPLTFTRDMADGVAGQDTVLFLQVPEAIRIFEDVALEDIYYEHVNYFTAASLRYMTELAGFEVTSLETTYGEQYLTLEGRPRAADAPAPQVDQAALAAFMETIASFEARANAFAAEWRARADAWKAEGKNIAIWGSGSKAVSFLSLLGEHGEIGQVVDINPRRQGHYMPRSGQKIIGPADLPASPPDVVVIMNRIYRDEIVRDLEKQGLSPEIICL